MDIFLLGAILGPSGLRMKPVFYVEILSLPLSLDQVEVGILPQSTTDLLSPII